MAVLINFKICDNDKACNGMSVCSKGVISWKDDKNTLEIDNSKCVNCGLCVKSCMVSAIKMAKTQEEYEKIEKEYEEDPRTINDLFIERYGAALIDPDAMGGTEDEIDDKMHSSRSLVLELYNEDSIMCLLKSIPIKELLQEFDVEARYRKVEVVSNKLLDRYNIKKLPALVFIKDQKVLGAIEGYYTDDNSRELYTQIHKLKNK